MEERKLKNTVTVEDIENLVLAFLNSDREENSSEIHQDLWRDFYNNMTDYYIDGRLIG